MKILTTKQTAEKLGVSERRIRAMIADGKIRAQRLEREYAIFEADVVGIKTYSKAGRPAASREKVWDDLINKFAGSVDSGMTDLATNKKHLSGFGGKKRG